MTQPIEDQIKSLPLDKLSLSLANLERAKSDREYNAKALKNMVRKTHNELEAERRLADGMERLEGLIRVEIERRAKGGARG